MISIVRQFSSDKTEKAVICWLLLCKYLLKLLCKLMISVFKEIEGGDVDLLLESKARGHSIKLITQIKTNHMEKFFF